MRTGIKISSLLLVAASGLCAQPSEELKKYKALFPGENQVVMKNIRDIRISIINGKPEIVSRITDEKIYLDERAGIYSEDNMEYSSFFTITDIEAYTLVPGKKKYKKIPVKEFKTKDVVETDIFYDDVKEIAWIYPSLSMGAKSVVTYTEKYQEPRFFGSHFFGSYIPVMSSEFRVTAPRDVKIDFRQFPAENAGIRFAKKEINGMVEYSFRMDSLQKLAFEDASPGIRYFAPHIVARITSYRVDGKETRLLTGVEDLHNWYYNMIRDVNSAGTHPGLVKVVDSLTSGLPSEVDKVKAIYYWVQDHIKYIAIEAGMEGFVPRNADAIYDKRYGDCKDMSSIITDMLDIAGIESHLTWIGTRSIPYTYEEVPTPASDNHMIATYIKDDKYYFLDATSQYNPFGYPSSAIQGKDAMVNMGGENFTIARVPVMESRDNHLNDSAWLWIENDRIRGKGKTTFTGYWKSRLTGRLIHATPGDQVTSMISFYNKGSNKFLIDSLRTSALENRDEALRVDYDFHIRDYHKTAGDEIYVNLLLEKDYPNDRIEPSRKNAIERLYKSLETYTVVLTIPEGYRLEHLPGNASFSHDLFGFDVSYAQQQGKVFCHTRLNINHLILQQQYFNDWNDMSKKLAEVYSNSVILKRK